MKPVVIFDVGNVILPFDPMRACRKLSQLCNITAEEICANIYARKLERRFEEGVIDGEEFCEGVASILSVPISTGELRAIWQDIFDENEPVSALVRRIKQHHRVLLLSNTNIWHWEFAVSKYRILSDVPEWILSYQVGVLKPDPLIYQTALRKLDGAGSVILVDDIEANVRGAREVEMTGVLFENVDQLGKDLRLLGVEIA